MAIEYGKNTYNKYGQPSLDLVFTGPKKSLVDRVSGKSLQFTRNTIGTYVDENGIIKTAVADEARFEKEGLLIEEARTNYFTNSTPTSTTWAQYNGSSITDNQATGPNGVTNSASLVTFPATGGAIPIIGGQGTGVSGTATVSMYVRAVTGTVSLQIGTNLAYGTTQIVGTSWTRIQFTTASLGTSAGLRSGDVNSVQNFYVFGGQIEAGVFPTSYIPTSGTTVTRAADVATVSNNNLYNNSQFDIVNDPFGMSAGSDTLTLLPSFSENSAIKRATIFSPNITQNNINSFAGKTDEFWRWRINATDGTFGLGSIYIGGTVTVDWGDGSALETINNGDNNTHTFAGGPGIYEVGFKGSNLFYTRFFYDTPNAVKVVAIGPAPENIRFDPGLALTRCTNLQSFDATVNTSLSTNMHYAFVLCSSLKSFPLLDTSNVTNFTNTWNYCSSLTSFPVIDTSSSTIFTGTWSDCTSLTSFPFIDTSSGTTFDKAWLDCTSLTSFPAIDTSNGTIFGSASSGSGAWRNCNSLTSFPLLDFSSATTIAGAWAFCAGLTSFPAIDTSSVTRFGEVNQGAWQRCTGLTSFPLLDTSNATSLARAWEHCSSLAGTFPSINTSNCTNFFNTWNNCSSLTAFPALDFSNATGNLGGATSGYGTWRNCSSLTSFPSIDISGINGSVAGAWAGCTGLTSFPLLDFSNVVIFGESNQGAWEGCTSLTSFPSQTDTSSGTKFYTTWQNCSSLTSFPALNFSNATDITGAWYGCSSLTSFPFIDTSNVITTSSTSAAVRGPWSGCTSLTSFPALNLSNAINLGGGPNGGAWYDCNSLTSFPTISFDSSTNFQRCWYRCTSMTDFGAGCFDTWSATPIDGCFYNAWDLCSSLTPASVVNILDSIALSGVSAPSGVGTGAKEITIDWDGTGTPATTSAAAITTLKSRNWVIVLNGVTQ